MERKKILIVDDEQDIREILLFNLRTAGYDADAATDADDAWSKMGNAYDLLLLDVMMPGMSGFELAARIRHDSPTPHIPIIFLTAKSAEEDALEGFSLGADDYVTKPFSIRELLARVKAVLHRTVTPQIGRQKLLSFKGLSMDIRQKTVSMGGTDISLTKTEFELLRLLMEQRGQVMSRQQLLQGAWPPDTIVTDRTVDVTVARLRKKLGPYAAHIAARQGYGYYFDEKK